MTTLAMARPLQGTVRERDRMVHLFEVEPAHPAGDPLTALCSKQFNSASLEFVNEVTGMPCEVCLSRSPNSAPGRRLSPLENARTHEVWDNRTLGNTCRHDVQTQFDEQTTGVETTTITAMGRDRERNVFDPTSDPLRYRYELLADYLAHLITTGKLPPNKPLPAERRLADEYGVSLGTARRATEELRLRRLVYTLRSRGTFVLPSEERRIHNVETD